MAANKPGVMIYFETLQAIDALSPEDTKQIIGAILRYARDGESPSLHGALAALWFFIKPSLDRDGARYDEMRTRGLWLTYCRKCKKEGIEPLPLEEWAAQQTVDGMLSCCEQPVEQRVNITVVVLDPFSMCHWSDISGGGSGNNFHGYRPI